MNTCRKRDDSRAFTIVDLLAIVVVIFVLVLVFLPDGPLFPQRHSRCSIRINCINNLKQTALAFRLWSGDNGDVYPMQALSTEAYGSFQLNATNGYRYFQIMSNELSTPKVIYCPTDSTRTSATNFTTDFDNSHVSYFLGLDASETNTSSFLAGDRNLTNGGALRNGILYVRTNQNVGWTKEMHNECGNVAMADGSVAQLSNKVVRAYLAKTGFVTNRLLFP
jgi:prepilin-type processing-associated H-X9-DG protein